MPVQFPELEVEAVVAAGEVAVLLVLLVPVVAPRALLLQRVLRLSSNSFR